MPSAVVNLYRNGFLKIGWLPWSTENGEVKWTAQIDNNQQRASVEKDPHGQEMVEMVDENNNDSRSRKLSKKSEKKSPEKRSSWSRKSKFLILILLLIASFSQKSYQERSIANT